MRGVTKQVGPDLSSYGLAHTGQAWITWYIRRVSVIRAVDPGQFRFQGSRVEPQQFTGVALAHLPGAGYAKDRIAQRRIHGLAHSAAERTIWLRLAQNWIVIGRCTGERHSKFPLTNQPMRPGSLFRFKQVSPHSQEDSRKRDRVSDQAYVEW